MDTAKIIGGVVSIVIGVVFLVVGGTVAEVTYGIGSAVVKAVNQTTIGILPAISSTVKSVLTIVGTALIAVGGGITIWALLEAVGQARGTFKFE
jgi:uncharacterized membrane protein